MTYLELLVVVCRKLPRSILKEDIVLVLVGIGDSQLCVVFFVRMYAGDEYRVRSDARTTQNQGHFGKTIFFGFHDELAIFW